MQTIYSVTTLRDFSNEWKIGLYYLLTKPLYLTV
ncbi:hypothetical protein Halar_2291 [halophilic archaeon DL31]|jgi:hypothetical protein|nr:hypothetical protein Halar_2291 [halophilic archaeon DL31]